MMVRDAAHTDLVLHPCGRTHVPECDPGCARGPMTIEGQVRALVAHEESGYEEWGASGAIRVNPSPSGRGLMVTIAPDTRALGTNSVFEGNARLAVEAGYGIGVGHGRGVLTPYAGLTLGDGGTRTMRTGMR